MRSALLMVIVLLIVVGHAYGQQPACVTPRADLVNPKVEASVSELAGSFVYRYRVTNQIGAQQRLISFAVETLTGPLPTQASPPNWVAHGRLASSSFLVWDTFVEPRGLAAGESTTGFSLTTAAPPAIVRYLAWNDVELPTFPDGVDPECENNDIFVNSYKGTTVGPKGRPEPFVPIEALNQLIALLHDSRRHQWIRRDGVHQSMLTKLTTAKRRLEAGDVAGAKNNVSAFVSQVAGASCEDFECHGNPPASSEAYALLYFNGRYLAERLP
jgi:hypothetical protein